MVSLREKWYLETKIQMLSVHVVIGVHHFQSLSVDTAVYFHLYFIYLYIYHY